MALGQKVSPFKDYEVGKIFIRYSWDLITDIVEFQKISGTGELEAAKNNESGIMDLVNIRTRSLN
jgi:membrane protease subunit (stomatin/prohibitin family)